MKTGDRARSQSQPWDPPPLSSPSFLKLVSPYAVPVVIYMLTICKFATPFPTVPLSSAGSRLPCPAVHNCNGLLLLLLLCLLPDPLLPSSPQPPEWEFLTYKLDPRTPLPSAHRCVAHGLQSHLFTMTYKVRPCGFSHDCLPLPLQVTLLLIRSPSSCLPRRVGPSLPPGPPWPRPLLPLSRSQLTHPFP